MKQILVVKSIALIYENFAKIPGNVVKIIYDFRYLCYVVICPELILAAQDHSWTALIAGTTCKNNA